MLIGRLLSHYRVLEQIGAGGMGVVFRARDEHLLRDVALKVLPAGALADEAARRRFRQEALSLSRLSHPNIETVYDFDSQEGIDFLVLEFVPGDTLSDRLARGPLPEEEVAALGRQLAAALAAAHSQGVIHRDLKPHNLKVTPDGQLKVLDFGLARLLETPDPEAPTRSLLTDGPLGTPPYMAPEQLRGETADHRTDIYATGAVLYEMATGRRPFGHLAGPLLTDAILHRDPPPPESLNPAVSARLGRVIMKALAKERRDRQGSARELEDEIGGRRAARAPLRRILRRLLTFAAGAAAILAAGLFGYHLLAPGQAFASLAVLPFANASGDPEVDYLSDGLTDSIIGSVSTLPRLKVIAWSSVSRYRGREVDPRRVGRDLNVATVLMGKLTYRSERLEVNAELVDTRDRSHLWGARYDGRLAEMRTINDQIARQISDGLRLRLSGEDERRIAGRSARSPEAYEHYLRGRHIFLTQYTGEGMRRAIDEFQKAIDVDPAYALAYAGIADAYYGLSNLYLPATEAMPRARAAALKAIELDDDLGEAHASLGVVKALYDWDVAGSEPEFRRAIALSPSSATTYLMYGVALSATDRVAEVQSLLAKALELDPLSSFVRTYVTMPMYVTRQYDQAAEQLRRQITVEPDFYLPHAFLGLVYEQQGHLKEAVEEFRTATRLDDNPEALAQLGHALALAGEPGEARRIIARLEGLSATRYVSPYNIAVIYLGLGERDLTFAWLDKALEDHSEWMHHLRVDPRFDQLHADPRFNAILRRTGLPPV